MNNVFIQEKYGDWFNNCKAIKRINDSIMNKKYSSLVLFVVFLVLMTGVAMYKK